MILSLTWFKDTQFVYAVNSVTTTAQSACLNGYGMEKQVEFQVEQ
jgi:hypothetical protein